MEHLNLEKIYSYTYISIVLENSLFSLKDKGIEIYLNNTSFLKLIIIVRRVGVD